MRLCGESWPIVLVSEMGNRLDPNETFGFCNRPEREPIEFGEGTSAKKPVSRNELVEKESRQGQTEESTAALVLGYEGKIFLRSYASVLNRRERLDTQRLLVRPDGSSSSFPPFKNASWDWYVINLLLCGNSFFGPRKTNTCARDDRAQTRESVRLMGCLLTFCLTHKRPRGALQSEIAVISVHIQMQFPEILF